MTSSSDSLHAKDGQPVVSVTIPILNAEKFLAEAIECVIAQTYSSWELLLVEDGSSDRSPEIANGTPRTGRARSGISSIRDTRIGA